MVKIRVCSACNILCHFLWGVTVPLLQRTRLGDSRPPPIGDRLGMRAHAAPAAAAASPVRGGIFLASPNMGEGRIYKGAFVEPPPLRAAPWGQATDDEWRSVLYSRSESPPY